MDESLLLACLASDHARLREAAAADLTATVSSRPGWTVADLAVDGVDEVLTVFLAYISRRWPKELGAALEEASGRSARVATDGGSWLVRTAPTGVEIDVFDPASAVTTVSGAPAGLLRWLWGRGGDDDLRFDGDREAIAELRRLLAAAAV